MPQLAEPCHLFYWCEQAVKQQLGSLQSQMTSLATHVEAAAAEQHGQKKSGDGLEDSQAGLTALQQRLRKIELTVAGTAPASLCCQSMFASWYCQSMFASLCCQSMFASL